MNKNKKRVSRVIFIIFFIPYMIMILFALYFAIHGDKVYTFVTHEYIRTDYGISVFIRLMTMLFLYRYSCSFCITNDDCIAVYFYIKSDNTKNRKIYNLKVI